MKIRKSLFLLMSLSFFCLLAIGQENQKRTEEYAILTFDEYSSKYFKLTIDIESEEFVEKKIEKQKGSRSIFNNLKLIMGEMKNLNQKGFELFSSSTGVLPGASGGGTAFFTYVFVRKIKE